MKKPIPKIRVFGQRSIVPSFLNRTPIPVEDPSKKADKCASFSEFLDSKLNKSVLFKPNNIEILAQEGPRPFTSFVSSKDLSQFSHDSDGGLEKTMLQQFKPSETQISEEVSRDSTSKASLEPLDQATAEEIDYLTSCFTENEDIIVKDDKTSKKRKDPFEVIRASVPKLLLDDVFEQKNEIAKALKQVELFLITSL
uniref:Hypersensitive-induced response protein 1 n=1 Tax=Noccaea caerulescens TaxID=107243 RepID=A0A1J3HC71_NOCCA